MTNENIIKALLRFNNRMKMERENHKFTTLIFNESIDALDEAIKALEQQPCEDCVSRADALKKIAKLNSTFVTNPDVIKAIADSLRIVEKLPSVISSTQIRDRCTQCIYEFGSKNCRTKNNDEWIYDCDFGHAEYIVRKDTAYWLSTFNTDSATECFTAVQELKKRLEGGCCEE